MIRRIKWPGDKTTKGALLRVKTLRCSLWLLMTCWLSKIAVKLTILLRNAMPRQTVIAFPVSPRLLLSPSLSLCIWVHVWLNTYCISTALDRRAETEFTVTETAKRNEATLHTLHSNNIASENLQICFSLGFYHHHENSFAQTSQLDLALLGLTQLNRIFWCHILSEKIHLKYVIWKHSILVYMCTYGTYKKLLLMGNQTHQNGWLHPGLLMVLSWENKLTPPCPVR